MSNNLFPVFDVPSALAGETEAQNKSPPAPVFSLIFTNGAEGTVKNTGNQGTGQRNARYLHADNARR